MPLPTSQTTWMQDLDLPSRVFGTGSNDYELYEEDGEFVLSVEMPGFEREEIDLSWYDGRLDVSAEHTEEKAGRKKTSHRTFRFPKEVDEDSIEATYRNGVLEVALPIEGVQTRGTSIEIQG